VVCEWTWHRRGDMFPLFQKLGKFLKQINEVMVGMISMGAFLYFQRCEGLPPQQLNGSKTMVGTFREGLVCAAKAYR